MKIIINSGHHTKYDSGAVGEYSTEAEVNYKVSKIVVDCLRKVGIDAYLIMENELKDIVDVANKWGVDYFVSLHCNGAESKEATGIETYIANGASEESNKLANCIQKQLIDTTGLYDRGVKTANYYVLKNTDMPAVLVEMGFITTPSEEDYLNKNYKEVARAIARGITDTLS